MKQFYTYLWLREDGTPYYAGKGRYRRIRQIHSKSGRRYMPPPLDRIIIQDWPDEGSAYEAEKFLIAYYGRKDNGTGVLINHSDGGEGSRGHKHTDEWKLKMSEKFRGREISLESREKMRLAKIGYVPWNKGKTGIQRAWNKGMSGPPASNELREKRRRFQLGRKASAETVLKLKSVSRKRAIDGTYC